jgi:hypothetical protein
VDEAATSARKFFLSSFGMSHVRTRMNRPSNTEVDRISQDEYSRRGRRNRNSSQNIDSSSLATVRELLKEIRRLEDEVCNQVIFTETKYVG